MNVQLIILAFLALVVIVVSDKRCDEFFNQPLLGETMSCSECCARREMVEVRGLKGFFKGCSCREAVSDKDKRKIKEANYVSLLASEFQDLVDYHKNSNSRTKYDSDSDDDSDED